MNSQKKKDKTLVLEPIGIDFWDRPVYKDQFGHLWKDVTLGSPHPQLCSALDDAFDGEPDMPIRKDFIIKSSQKKPIEKEKKFQYQMLDRLRNDCDYYLGYGDRNPGVLPSSDERKHIETMKDIWKSFSDTEKPEWLTWEQILDYEKAMCQKD